MAKRRDKLLPDSMISLCLLLLLQDAPRAELEGSVSYYELTHGRGYWRSEALDLRVELEPRFLVFGGVEDHERFREFDQELRIGSYFPIGRFTLHGEYATSPTHHVIPMHVALGEIGVSIDPGWGLWAGAKYTEHTHLWSRVGWVTLEKYIADFRIAYTVFYGDVEDAGDSVTHRLELSRFYDERSFVKFSVVVGEEEEDIGPPRGVLVSDIVYGVLAGKHYLSDRWAFTYEFTITHQGDVYSRYGFRLGLVVVF